jgi:hypothetical protein
MSATNFVASYGTICGYTDDPNVQPGNFLFIVLAWGSFLPIVLPWMLSGYLLSMPNQALKLVALIVQNAIQGILFIIMRWYGSPRPIIDCPVINDGTTFYSQQLNEWGVPEPGFVMTYSSIAVFITVQTVTFGAKSAWANYLLSAAVLFWYTFCEFYLGRMTVGQYFGNLLAIVILYFIFIAAIIVLTRSFKVLYFNYKATQPEAIETVLADDGETYVVDPKSIVTDALLDDAPIYSLERLVERINKSIEAKKKAHAAFIEHISRQQEEEQKQSLLAQNARIQTLNKPANRLYALAASAKTKFNETLGS